MLVSPLVRLRPLSPLNLETYSIVSEDIPALNMAARPSLLPTPKQSSLNAFRPEITTDWGLRFLPREIAFPCYTTLEAFQRVLERTFLSTLDFALRSVKHSKDPLIAAYLSSNVPANAAALQRLQVKEQRKWKYQWVTAVLPAGSGIVGWEYRPQDGRSGAKVFLAALPFWEYTPERFSTIVRDFVVSATVHHPNADHRLTFCCPKIDEAAPTASSETPQLDLVSSFLSLGNGLYLRRM